LEGLNKFLGTRMLISEDAFFPDNDYLTRQVGQFVFKGKSRPVRVREIFPKSASFSECRISVGQAFASGLQLFENQRWDEAEESFGIVLQVDENDGPSRFFLKLCRHYQQAPPCSDWNGAVYLDQK
jgi:adenylate cyclase